ncbi:MAG: endonuclease/exonuclease/phosphatase family protein [Candidatus Eiseniibacteriota bacterium]
MIDRFEILGSHIRRLVSRNRWSARLLGHRPEAGRGDEPGLVLLQIDGLGEAVLTRAMAEGKMPFLRHLVEDEGYGLHALYSGMPSNTPAFQGELFYGVKAVVPGFGFLDRETGREMVMNGWADSREIQGRLEARGKGLLAGGSAWSDIYAGGAAESHLCASTTGFGHLLGALNPLHLAALAVWHTWSAIRVVANFVVELGLAVLDFVRGTLAGRQVRAELRFILERVAVTAVMREIVTAGAAVDAERGLPVIHVNFLGYDEHGHRRGPDSAFALWTLKGIDRSMRRIWLAAHRSPRRDYQVWIYSDHGQEPVVAYRKRHGDVADVVTRIWDRLEGRQDPPAAPDPRALAEAAARSRSEWLRRQQSGPEPVPAGQPGAPRVVHRGSVGFVYLPRGTAVQRRDELALAMATEGGVPMVLAADADGAALVWTGSARPLRLPADSAEILGDHPYREQVAEDVLRVVHHESAGELTLLGWSRNGSISFKIENGAHGSAGPRETSAFLLLPPEMSHRLPAGAALRPLDLRSLARDVLDPRTPHISIRRARARRSEPDPRIRRIRVMTYNVHGCRGMDGRYSTQRIARVIARASADVVCLQELDHGRTRSGGVEQAVEIARQLEKEFRFHAVAEIDDGLFGNAVLSSHALRLRASGALPRLDSRIALPARGVLWVEVDLDGVVVQVLNTHLSIHERERRLQAADLVDNWLRRSEGRDTRVLAGDFNASAGSWTARTIERVLRNVAADGPRDAAHTWSGRVPLRRIDHVFVSEDVRVAGAHVPRSRLTRVASDHLPLVVELLLPRVDRSS